MTIPASPNSVSLYQIKDEADNSAQDSSVSTASAMSLNDSDVRGLIGKASGATMSFSEWRGVSGISLNTWPLSGVSTAPDPWGSQSFTDSNYAQVGCNYGQKVDTANDRLEHRFTTFNSGAASVFSYAYQSYVGLDSATFEAKAVYSTTTSGAGTASTSGPATNTWTTVSTSVYSPVWQWLATVNSGSGTRYVNGSVTFYMRASLGGTYYPNSSGYNSGSKVISLTATRGTAGPGGGGGGL
jgi:hypothetical protein